MIRTFENIETIFHKAIDLIGKAAIGVAKAAVTLLCLGGSLAYTTGVKLRKTFDNYNQDKTYQTQVATEDTINATNSEGITEITNTQAKEPKVEISELADLTQGVVTVIESINIVKPISHNTIENYITDSLKYVLESNLVEATTYKLPKNKRVKSKTHIKHNNEIGVLKEYYPALIATGVLR